MTEGMPHAGVILYRRFAVQGGTLMGDGEGEVKACPLRPQVPGLHVIIDLTAPQHSTGQHFLHCIIISVLPQHKLNHS